MELGLIQAYIFNDEITFIAGCKFSGNDHIRFHSEDGRSRNGDDEDDDDDGVPVTGASKPACLLSVA